MRVIASSGDGGDFKTLHDFTTHDYAFPALAPNLNRTMQMKQESTEGTEKDGRSLGGDRPLELEHRLVNPFWIVPKEQPP